MSYQKCPKCNGSGKKYNNLPVVTGHPYFDVLLNMPSAASILDKDVCPVCNGKMIISTLTGQPPK